MSFDTETATAIDPRSIKIPVFEGPMDLLLHLIKLNKIDIYDIPISLITHQYLQYLEMMKEYNLEIASEFLVMAATLIYIKSRMLLPPDEDIEQAEVIEDPRAGLVQRLLEYQAYKEASTILSQRETVWLNAFSRSQVDPKTLLKEPEPILFDIDIYDLVTALKKILANAPAEAITITKETLTVQDRMMLILQLLDKATSIKFEGVFEGDASKLEIIVTFLALLELLRLGAIRVYQNEEFSDIWIMRQNEDKT